MRTMTRPVRLRTRTQTSVPMQAFFRLGRTVKLAARPKRYLRRSIPSSNFSYHAPRPQRREATRRRDRQRRIRHADTQSLMEVHGPKVRARKCDYQHEGYKAAPVILLAPWQGPVTLSGFTVKDGPSSPTHATLMGSSSTALPRTILYLYLIHI